MKQTITRHDFAELFEQYRKECDIIGFCCDFSEYESALEAVKEYTADDLDSEEAAAFLRDRTTLIEFDGGIIIQDF